MATAKAINMRKQAALEIIQEAIGVAPPTHKDPAVAEANLLEWIAERVGEMDLLIKEQQNMIRELEAQITDLTNGQETETPTTKRKRGKK